MIRKIREQTRRDFYRLWDAWRNKTKRKVSVWAKEERMVAAGGPLARGEDIKWNPDVMPHANEPMDEVDNDDVNVIVLWFGRRMAKTEGVCMNVIGRTVDDSPDNVISMWPVEDSRDRFSRDVVETTIQATPRLRGRFVAAKSRDAGRTIGYKRFHGGSLIINYAGSKSQTKGMAAGVIMAHEIDAYPASSQGEGDPIEKLLGRAEGFASAVKILESTGTRSAIIGPDGKKQHRSNIEKWYDLSDQRKWFCPCRKCGAAQWLKWEQIREMERKGGEAIFYLCEKCDADHAEKQWQRMVSGGEWRPTAPFLDGIRGYWINGFNSLLPKGRGFKTKLHQFFAEGNRALAAKSDVRRVWVNEVKTELMDDDENSVEAPAHQPILDGREDYATKLETGELSVIVPDPAAMITSMTDVHGNRLEIEWRAWAENEESWGVGHFVLYGDTSRPEVWYEWTSHLQRKFTHASGGEMGLELACIDAGWRGDSVASVLRRLITPGEMVPGVSGKIRATKGTANFGAVVHARWRTISGPLKGIHIGTWAAKSLIYERLRWHGAKEKPTAGFIHFGKVYGDEFIRQIVSEKSVFKFIPEVNREVETFKNPDQSRNEGLDLIVGNLAAFRDRVWGNAYDWQGARAAILRSAGQPEKSEPEEKEPEESKPFPGQRGGFGSGWSV